MDLANEHAYLSGLVAQGGGNAIWAKAKADEYGLDLTKAYTNPTANQGGNTTVLNTTTSSTQGATQINTSTGGTIITGELRDEYGNIKPSSGFNTEGVTQAATTEGGFWDRLYTSITQPIADIWASVSNVAKGANQLSEKFFSLAIWWLPIIFVIWVLTKVAGVKGGSRWLSFGRR